jgi:excisionase family DNA binding protein
VYEKVIETVTLLDAARVLGVSRTTVWAMLRTGELQAYQDPIDKRRRLIPMQSIRSLLERRGQPPRSRPRTVGMVSDGSVQSEDIEEHIGENWRFE